VLRWFAPVLVAIPVLLYDDIMPVLEAATCGAAVALIGGSNFVG